LVDWAVVQRMNSMRHGWNKLDPTTARLCCDRLRHWLNCNPTPSAASLRAFWHQHEATVRYVMPPNGRKRMERLQHIMSSL
jgi:hypothetical protein